MTNEKANNMLDDISWSYGGESITTDDIVECRKICHEALEKQIPKKATEEETNRGIDISGEYDIDFDLCCPVCGAVVGTYEAGVNEYFENYCSNCGQAIDVSYSGCEEGAEK